MALSALFTGSTGLRANSSTLDTVGNNLANINTTGYKGQRLVFKDLVYQTLNPGSAPAGGLGGTNPTQSGFGVGVGSVDNLFQQGAVTPTGRSLDAALQGTGFFVMSNGQATAYSRAGSFSVDAAGYLVDPNTGFRVQRTGPTGEGSATAPGFQVPGVTDIQVPFGAGVAGVSTTTAQVQGNLGAGLLVGQSVTAGIQVYDAQSTPRALTVTFTKTAPNTFDVTATVSGGTATVQPDATTGTTVTFGSDGLLAGPGSLAVRLSGIPGITAPQDVTLDFGTVGQATGLTQFGGASTAALTTQDGAGAGVLTAVSFDTSGIVQGQFSNGRTIALAQLAIAGFNNESGLLRQGNNYFSASASSGQALVGVAGTGGRGTVQGSALEGSNVDIAVEFSRLIIAQRGFQVNARTMTAANETLQELANVIR
ncbi:MAG: flagellar hook protein FlgE [Gemmataceae bacterium]|nr:flagellar hook protein FlgE [Gemmataceae bacterium]